MNRRTILTLSTAASLYGLYSLYALFVSPHFSPPLMDLPAEQSVPQAVRSPGPAENHRQAVQWLAHQPWASDAKYQVLMDNAFIYTDDWKQVPGEQGVAQGTPKAGSKIRFKPFAMIWHRAEDSPDSPPLTIVSESALLTFSGQFEPSMSAKSDPGRVVGASLDGKVQIRGNDGLSVVGRDFVFEEAALKVWSANPIAFTYRNSRGNGLGLDMDLIPGPGRGSRDKPNVAGVRTLRLLSNVTMNLVPEPKPGKGSKIIQTSASQPEKKEQAPRTVVITSRGRFEYVVEAALATFQNHVQVRSPTGPNEFDSLSDCDFLTLVFERVAKKGAAGKPRSSDETVPQAKLASASTSDPASPASKKAGQKTAGQGDLEFRRLKAEGKAVVLTSDHSQMVAHASELIYDTESRAVYLRDDRLVNVVQKNQEISSAEITVLMDSAGKVLSSKCQGQGAVRSYDPLVKAGSPRKLQFAADWKKQMLKYPDPTSPMDIVELEGEAVLNQPGKLALKGEIIKIWFTPEEKKAEGISSPVPPAGTASKRPGAKPKRLLARNEVKFATPQLRGETNQLEVWFEQGALPLHPTAGRGARGRALVQNTAATELEETMHVRRREVARPTVVPESHEPAKNSRRGPARRLTRGGSSGFADIVDDPVPPKRDRRRGEPGTAAARDPAGRREAKPNAHPLNVTADLIRVRTLQEAEKSEVAEVWTEGKVHVTQERDKGGAPLDVHGDRLHLWNYVGNSQVLRILGQPADVRDRGMQLEGADINLDRLRNTMYVKGAGMLRLPLQNGADGKKLAKPQFLDVWWKERMQFNGLVAEFFVDVKSVFGQSRVNCQEMEVQLTRRVSFSEGTTEEQQAEVDMVRCKEGVDVINNEYVGNRLMEVRKAKAWQLTMWQKSGDITASGPGIMRIWRRSNGSRPAGFGGNRTNRPKPETEPDAEASSSLPWEYTRVDFAGDMQGNRTQRSTTFKDRVQVVHGPVSDSTEVIDVDKNLPRDGGWMRCESLQLTQHPQEEQQAAYLQMLASGNAEMGGREFKGQADTISYDQSKGLFLLRSVGTRMATIWRQLTPGAEASRAEAQWMEYTPSRNHLKFDRTSGIQGLP